MALQQTKFKPKNGKNYKQKKPLLIEKDSFILSLSVKLLPKIKLNQEVNYG